jgi:hypothetical protein
MSEAIDKSILLQTKVLIDIKELLLEIKILLKENSKENNNTKGWQIPDFARGAI